MTTSREQVRDHLVKTLQSMGDEWDEQAEITEETKLFGDLNWRSIEVIYLTNVLQQHYQHAFPFEEFLKDLQARNVADSTVAEWVDFLTQELNKSVDAT